MIWRAYLRAQRFRRTYLPAVARRCRIQVKADVRQIVGGKRWSLCLITNIEKDSK